MRAVALVFVVGACGDNLSETPILGTARELSLLNATDPSHPFNQSSEVSLAASNGVVVVGSIDLHFPSADSFQIGDGLEFRKRVGVHVSADRGDTFGDAIDPVLGGGTFISDQTSDPVVQVTRDGVFYLMVGKDSPTGGLATLARSKDGTSWENLATVPHGDRQWFALNDVRKTVYIGARDGYWETDYDGAVLMQVTSGEAVGYLMAGAYSTRNGARFGSLGTPTLNQPTVLDWDGAQVRVVEALDSGPDAELYTTVAWGLGSLLDGMWSIRARRDGSEGALVLRMESSGSSREQLLTKAGALAFLPAATMDLRGRLHVIWYDASGSQGVLEYTHSRGPAPFTTGFIEPVVIDSNATPGNGWYPGFDTDKGFRRLREYIGIATDGDDVYVAWTHAPSAPSRVWVMRIEP